MSQDAADDPEIFDHDELWRRIPPRHLVPDQNRNCIRISSAAFEDDSDNGPLSVVIGRRVIEAGRTPKDILRGHDEFGLVSISAKLARDNKQRLLSDPLPEEMAHALVAGEKPKSVRKRFAAAALWVVHPPGRIILSVERLPPAWVMGKTEATAHELLSPPKS